MQARFARPRSTHHSIQLKGFKVGSTRVYSSEIQKRILISGRNSVARNDDAVFFDLLIEAALWNREAARRLFDAAVLFVDHSFDEPLLEFQQRHIRALGPNIRSPV